MLTKEDLQAISGLIAESLKPIQSDIKDMKSDIKDMKSDIKDIQLTLETETNPNIKAIAEGHLDLSRKLDEALKVENEKEMLILRVNTMENELRRIKAKLETIA